MHLTSILTTIFAAVLGASATAIDPRQGPAPKVAKVVNHCSFQVTVWVVGSTISPAYNLTPSGGFYAEGLQRDPVTGGRVFKVTREPDGIFTGKPQLNFAYNLDGANVWYDLSYVFGDAFAGSRLQVESSITTCPKITWPQGTHPGGSQVKVCAATGDVTLTLCSA